MNETGPSVQKDLESQGMKRTPRTWIDDALDKLEVLLEARLSKDPGHPYKDSEFRNWVTMQNEILESMKRLNEFNAFLGHRFVAAERKHAELKRASKPQAKSPPKLVDPPKTVTSDKSLT